ncbi:MAG: hypothetical protein WA609_09680 [Terriglobales bacterium]
MPIRSLDFQVAGAGGGTTYQAITSSQSVLFIRLYAAKPCGDTIRP